MKAELKKLPKSQVELTLTVPYATYKQWEKKAIEDLNHEIKVPGFRSGHIPEEILRQRISEQGLRAATLDYVLPQTYSKAVSDHQLQVVARPVVEIKSEPQKEGDDLVYVATVAVMPEVKVGDYHKIKIARKPVNVEAKQVDEAIQIMVDRVATWKDVERKAKKGDRVEADFEGFDEAGKAIPNTLSRNHPIVLGSGVMVPGFEDAIVGLGKDDKKEFTIRFPDEYHAKHLQGKPVTFKLSVSRLEEKVEQALDEALVERVSGRKQPVEAFRKQVEEELRAEGENRNQQEHDSAVVNEIIKITQVDLPEAMIDQEIETMLEDQKARLKQQGVEWADFLKRVNKTDADFKKDHRKAAEERLTARLGVQHILRDSKIAVTDQDVAAKIEEIAARYPEEQRKTVLDHYEKDPQAKQILQNNLAADKLINMLSK